MVLPSSARSVFITARSQHHYTPLIQLVRTIPWVWSSSAVRAVITLLPSLSLKAGMPEKPTKFVEEPPALMCPVCKKIFREPVISVKCGHTFCRMCIEDMIKNGLTCPIDEQECDSGQLVLNRAVNRQIDDLMIFCCHGLVLTGSGRTHKQDPSGCKEVIRLGKRDEHESKCKFAKVCS